MPPSSTLPATTNSTFAAVDTAIARVAKPAEYFVAEVNGLADATRQLADAFVSYGDQCPVGDLEDRTNVDCRLRHYEWAERAKHFLVLFRNVQLQIQTAEILVTDGRTSPEPVNDLHERSLTTLRAARAQWEEEMGQLRQSLERDTPAARRRLNDYHAQRNPWPAYRQQFTEVKQQSADLAREFMTLTAQSGLLRTAREELLAGIQVASDTITTALNQADEVLAFVLDDQTAVDARPGKIAARLEDFIADGALPPQLHDYTNAAMGAVKQMAEQVRVTVGSDHGLLQFKDVNFRRATDQWISAEVLPEYYEIWEISEQVRSGLGVAMNNVRNRALLAANDQRAGGEADYDLDDLSQPFYDFLARAREQFKQFNALAANQRGLLEADLRLASVYREGPGFLPLPLQTGINEFTRRQGRVITSFRDWLGGTFAGLERWRSNAVREEQMSISEKLVRVIEQRQPAPGNEDYTNIVLTKGYIGESFLVGREEEAAHVARLIANWRKGYRGAVMLTGKRLSGKSLFGEMISNRLFPDNVFRLAPNTVLSVEGRRMTTSGDLAEALAFVQKHTLQSRPMVWIDDLETWWDKNHSLAQNVRALASHIDSYSTRIFYLVSTTTANYDHFNRNRELDLVFQATVNMDDFSLEKAIRAVRIRHGATHKRLVDEDGEPLSDVAFNRLVRKLHRATAGNIGDTIHRWAYLMEYCDEDRVTPNEQRRYHLPAFLTVDNGTILTAIYRQRSASEYHLRQLFGPAFESRYRSVLQRMIRVGLVVRGNDNQLRIRESVVTGVATALENNGYLNCVD